MCAGKWSLVRLQKQTSKLPFILIKPHNKRRRTKAGGLKVAAGKNKTISQRHKGDKETGFISGALSAAPPNYSAASKPPRQFTTGGGDCSWDAAERGNMGSVSVSGKTRAANENRNRTSPQGSPPPTPASLRLDPGAHPHVKGGAGRGWRSDSSPEGGARLSWLTTFGAPPVRVPPVTTSLCLCAAKRDSVFWAPP